jgi:hypothetical protein
MIAIVLTTIIFIYIYISLFHYQISFFREIIFGQFKIVVQYIHHTDQGQL